MNSGFRARALRWLPVPGLMLAVLAAGCEPGRPPEETEAADAALAALSGEELAGRYCQGCHLLPDPQSLDRASWRDWVLPNMGHRLGIYHRPGLREDSLLEPGVAGEIVRAAGIYPDEPVLPREAWDRLVSYYLSRAPDSLPAPPPHPPVRVGLPHFRVRVPELRTNPPMASLVKIDPAGGRILVGDVKRDFSTLEVLDRNAKSLQSIGMESAPAHVRVRGDSLQVLLMGRILPTDNPSGLLRTMFKAGGAPDYNAAVRMVDGLQRPVHVSYADLDADGLEDLVVSEFGYLTGQLAWYRQTPGGGYTRQVLRPLPGSTVTEVRDVDGDGRPDVVALIAQGDEGVYLYRNQGGGRFAEERLLRFPPSYGSIWMDLQDFNGDGHFDILYSNGDNGDYAPVPKPYHGVRVFLNDGRNQFREAYFYPLFGAFQARARDFDLDGDLDIAAVAFYPEYRRPPAEGFVYLRNQGGMKFEPSTFPEVHRGRWITFDAGDLDRDGDEDIVLGSFVAFDPVGDTTGLHQEWLRGGPLLVILENTTR